MFEGGLTDCGAKFPALVNWGSSGKVCMCEDTDSEDTIGVTRNDKRHSFKMISG
jgi:hypothetical protein